MVDFSDLIPKPANLQMPGQQPQQPGMFDDLIPKIDYSQPNEQVRAAIQALPEEGRRHHYDQWAKQYVAKENQQGGVMQAVDNSVRTLARGSFVGPWLGELQAGSGAAMHAITGGRMGAPYQEGIAYQNARDDYVDEKYPVLSTAGQLATGIGSGVRAAQIGARALSPASLIAGPVAPVANAPTRTGRVAGSVAMGAAYGANAGAGDARGGFGDAMEGAARGAAVGGVLGGAVGAGGELYNVAKSAFARTGSDGAYDLFGRSLGQPLDDFERSVVLGTRTTPNANQAEDIQLFRRIGEVMEANGGDHALARNTILQELQQQGLSRDQALERVRRLTGTHPDSNLFLGEYGAVAPANEAQRTISGGQQTTAAGRAQMLDSPAGSATNPNSIMPNEDQLHLFDTVVQGGGRGATTVKRALEARQSQAPERFERQMQGNIAPTMRMPNQPTSGPGSRPQPLTLEDANVITRHLEQNSSRGYRAVHNTNDPVELANRARVINNELPFIMNWIDQNIAGRAGAAEDEFQKAAREFSKLRDMMAAGQTPTLQHLQDVRAAIRSQRNALDRAGRDQESLLLRPLYDGMTRMMSRASPQWAQYNRQWGEIRRFDDALELGERLSLKAGRAQREAMEEYRNLGAPAQAAARVGMLRQIYDKIANVRDTNDVSKVMDLKATHNLVRQMFGDEAAVTFARAVRDIEVGSRTKNTVGNSRTNTRGRQDSIIDADLGIVAAVQTGNRTALLNWVTQHAQNALTLGRNGIVADITTTPMSDTFRVAERLRRARSVGERLRQADTPSRVAPSIGAGLAQRAGQFLAPE